MNGIEKITAKIEAEAQAEIDQILSDAQAEAERITQDYRRQAEEEARQTAARNEKAAAEREERLVSVAQMESRKVKLGAKQEMVEKAFRLALEKLSAMPREQYTEVLADLMVRASSTGKEEVILSKKDHDTVGKAAVEKANQASGKSLKLSRETREIPGGLILKDRSVEVNCAFDTLVRLQKAETAGAVAKKLFPEG